jgi:hypothetical protein
MIRARNSSWLYSHTVETRASAHLGTVLNDLNCTECVLLVLRVDQRNHDLTPSSSKAGKAARQEHLGLVLDSAFVVEVSHLP